MRVLRVLLGHLFQKGLGFVHALQVQQRDTTIQASGQQLRVARGRLFESLQGFFKELLVHVRDADIV